MVPPMSCNCEMIVFVLWYTVLLQHTRMVLCFLKESNYSVYSRIADTSLSMYHLMCELPSNSGKALLSYATIFLFFGIFAFCIHRLYLLAMLVQKLSRFHNYTISNGSSPNMNDGVTSLLAGCFWFFSICIYAHRTKLITTRRAGWWRQIQLWFWWRCEIPSEPPSLYMCS